MFKNLMINFIVLLSISSCFKDKNDSIPISQSESKPNEKPTDLGQNQSKLPTDIRVNLTEKEKAKKGIISAFEYGTLLKKKANDSRINVEAFSEYIISELEEVYSLETKKA